MDRMGTSGKGSGGTGASVSFSPGGWGDGSSRLGRAGKVRVTTGKNLDTARPRTMG